MKIKSLLLALTLLFLSAPSYAQFEGQMDIEVHDRSNENAEVTQLSLTTTKDRIFIDSAAKVNVVSGLQTDGILIRNDLQDFVFRTDENEALKVSKSDLDGLIQMINRFQGGSSGSEKKEKFDWETRVEETGNSRTIHGYSANEFTLKGEEENQYVSIWLTDEIKVNWGLLLDFWYESGENFTDSDIPIELVLNKNSFPLLVDVYDEGEVVYSAKVTGINTDNFDRSKVELSDDVTLIGFSDMMMNMFRQRR
ncbi:MAG: DUF4412 domain-containing protein [Balneolaceae bacterium]